MARIAVGGLHHETNTFAPQKATFDRFAEADGWPELLRGEPLLVRPHGTNLALAGFLDAAGAAGHELVPLVWANAGPSGHTTEDAFERIVGVAARGSAEGAAGRRGLSRSARGHGHRASGRW